jgi:diacylglycerol O-acyltransferase
MRALRSAKERHNAIPVDAMRAANDLLMPALFIRASRAAMLSQARRLKRSTPVGGVVGGFGLSTIVFSYCDALQFGFVVDADCPADPRRLADAYEREQKKLLGLLPSLD